VINLISLFKEREVEEESCLSRKRTESALPRVFDRGGAKKGDVKTTEKLNLLLGSLPS